MVRVQVFQGPGPGFRSSHFADVYLETSQTSARQLFPQKSSTSQRSVTTEKLLKLLLAKYYDAFSI